MLFFLGTMRLYLTEKLTECSGPALLVGAADGLWLLLPAIISQTLVLGNGKDLQITMVLSSWIAIPALCGGWQFVVAQVLITYLFHLLGALRKVRFCSD